LLTRLLTHSPARLLAFPLSRFLAFLPFLPFLLFLGCGGEEKKEIRLIEAAEDFTQLSTDELDFGRHESKLGVMLSNNNNVVASWKATADVSWITVQPERGVIDPWSEVLIRITVERSQLTKSEGVGLVIIAISTYGEQKHIRVKVQA
jgi:hypothetical protein